MNEETARIEIIKELNNRSENPLDEDITLAEALKQLIELLPN